MKVLCLYPISFIKLLNLLAFLLNFIIQVLHLFLEPILARLNIRHALLMRVYLLLQLLVYFFQFLDSALEYLFFGLNEFGLLLFVHDNFGELLFELSLKLLDSVLVFGAHLVDDFFVDGDLLVEGVDDDVFLLLHVFELVDEAVVDGLELSVF